MTPGNNIFLLVFLMAFSPNGFLNQVLSNGQEPIMGYINIIVARPYLGLSGDKGSWKSLKINISWVEEHY
jgi:hypothetical protein